MTIGFEGGIGAVRLRNRKLYWDIFGGMEVGEQGRQVEG